MTDEAEGNGTAAAAAKGARRPDRVKSFAAGLGEAHVRALKSLTGIQVDRMRAALSDLDQKRKDLKLAVDRAAAAEDDVAHATADVDGWAHVLNDIVDAMPKAEGEEA